MDMALDTVSQSALDLGQRLETILRRGHLYENVVASDNSNVHNGDRIYVTYNVTYNTSSSCGSTPMSTDPLQDSISNKSAQSPSTPKRKRAASDGGSRERASRDNDCKAFEDALVNLGGFSRLKEHLEKGRNATKITAYLSLVLKTLVQVEYDYPSSDDTRIQPDDLVHQLKHTRCVKLNTVFPQRQVALLSRQDSIVVGAQVGHWRVSLNTIVVNTQHPYVSQACAVLHAQPSRNSGDFHIAALFSRTTDMDHVANAHPVILVYERTYPLCRQLLVDHASSLDPDWFGKKVMSHVMRMPSARARVGQESTGMTFAGHMALYYAARLTTEQVVQLLFAKSGRIWRIFSKSNDEDSGSNDSVPNIQN